MSTSDVLVDLASKIVYRLECFRDQTPMWGSNEAVELQAITLIEVEAFLHDRSINRRRVFEAYLEELYKVCPAAVGQPLSAVIADPQQFGQVLFTVCAKLRLHLGLT